MRTKFKDRVVVFAKCICGKEVTINVHCGHKNIDNIEKKRFEAPTPEEVEAYGKKINHEIDGQAFCSYYESIGWVVGRSCKPMKNWRAAVRYWKSSSKKKNKNYITRNNEKNLEYLLEAYATISKKELELIDLNSIAMVTSNVMEMYKKLAKPIRRKMELQGGRRAFLKLYAKYITRNLGEYYSIRESSLDVESKTWHGFVIWLSTQYFGVRNIFRV